MRIFLIILQTNLVNFEINYCKRREYSLESIGRESSHNIEVGPHAHDSKDNSLHHCQGKF